MVGKGRQSFPTFQVRAVKLREVNRGLLVWLGGIEITKCCGFNGDPFLIREALNKKQLLYSLVGFDGKKVKRKQAEQLTSRTDENS